MKITLLDDEFSLRNNIKDFLEFHHYEVEAYADGTSLLEKTNFDSDLYILDINVCLSNPCPPPPCLLLVMFIMEELSWTKNRSVANNVIIRLNARFSNWAVEAGHICVQISMNLNIYMVGNHQDVYPYLNLS